MVTGSALVSRSGIPNLAMWARDASDNLTNVSSGQKYNTFYGAHVKYVGLDITILNAGGTVATVTIDGIPFNISAGTSRAITNFPYTEVLVTAGTNLDLIMQGILWDVGEKLGYLAKENVALWQ